MKKLKKFLLDHIDEHTVICIWLLFVIAMAGMFIWGVSRIGTEKDYIEHEVLSCIQYVSINVDEDGGVLNEDICYAFTFKEDDDQLLHVTEFTEDEYTTVHIGEENKIVFYDDGDTKLYLTREVLSEFFYTKVTEFEYD